MPVRTGRRSDLHIGLLRDFYSGLHASIFLVPILRDGASKVPQGWKLGGVLHLELRLDFRKAVDRQLSK